MNDTVVRDENYYRKVLVSLLLVTFLVILVISLSYSLYYQLQKENTYETNNSSRISMNYTEETNGIFIENATPVSDEVGMKLTNNNEYFDFNVATKMIPNTKVQYEIVAVKDKTSTIPDEDIKIYLEEQKNGTYVKSTEPVAFKPSKDITKLGAPEGSMVIKTVTEKNTLTRNYRLRMWLSKESTITDVKKYAIKINVYGRQIGG